MLRLCQSLHKSSNLHYHIAVIDFSDDTDLQLDSEGEYSRASLTQPEMPKDFTICSSFRTYYWTIRTSSSPIFQLMREDGLVWASILLFAGPTRIEYEVVLGKVSFIVVIPDTILFPLTWTHTCMSLDTVSGRVVLVSDGRVLDDSVREQAKEEDAFRPATLTLTLGILGHVASSVEQTGMISGLNMFSQPLTNEAMMALTQSGGDECGVPGDYISWNEADWQLHSQARMVMVDEEEGPCRRQSEVTVYDAGFIETRHCMEHCQKVGGGRSPPVRTLEEWEWLTKEVFATALRVEDLPVQWMAATDEEQEGVWRDWYTPHHQIGTNWTVPWYGPDTMYGQDYNCMLWFTSEPADRCWYEWQCFGGFGCTCKYQRQPVLILRGRCKDGLIDEYYTPKQLPDAPGDLFLLGRLHTQIRYNTSNNQWRATDPTNPATALSTASHLSYLLGKHSWNVTGDGCNNGQQYTTLLKLSGCNPEGEFTCNDGQCVEMEQRCDQIPDCRDESDEKGCQLLVLKESFNKNIPPISPVSETDRTVVPVPVHISISLLKIVRMEEVQHKIDLQFEITLEWKENRATYLNLKKKTSLNALTDEEISTLWLPYVIYSNTDMKEAVQLEDGLKTTIVVTREGNFTRSSNEEVDETEYFKGKDNKLVMSQTYTKSFQCPYHLQQYPFETQVDNAFN